MKNLILGLVALLVVSCASQSKPKMSMTYEPPGNTLPTVYVTYQPRTDLWYLTEDYTLEFQDYVFYIPEGYPYDLATIPPFFRPYINTYELGLVAPLIHDVLYNHAGELHTGWTDSDYYSRKQADQIFYDIMLEEGVTRWKAKGAYGAVRMFSWGFYGHKHPKHAEIHDYPSYRRPIHNLFR